MLAKHCRTKIAQGPGAVSPSLRRRDERAPLLSKSELAMAAAAAAGAAAAAAARDDSDDDVHMVGGEDVGKRSEDESQVGKRVRNSGDDKPME